LWNSGEKEGRSQKGSEKVPAHRLSLDNAFGMWDQNYLKDDGAQGGSPGEELEGLARTRCS
jgi:hypothetical protein